MTLVVDEVDKWTKVIESIDQDMVPIDCIKKIKPLTKGYLEKL